jgi:hypothetical protein
MALRHQRKLDPARLTRPLHQSAARPLELARRTGEPLSVLGLLLPNSREAWLDKYRLAGRRVRVGEIAMETSSPRYTTRGRSRETRPV